MKGRTLEVLVFIVTTIGLLGYLFWLVYRVDQIYDTQEGVLYILPCVPIFFIYACLFHRAPGNQQRGKSSGRGNQGE